MLFVRITMRVKQINNYLFPVFVCHRAVNKKSTVKLVVVTVLTVHMSVSNLIGSSCMYSKYFTNKMQLGSG